MQMKSTKKALALSLLSLVVCVSLLIGTTFAWFTDSVTSANNKIIAGNLKVDLEVYTEQNDGSYKFVSVKNDKTAIFNYSLWEPGYVEAELLKVENEGSLALKWKAMFVSAGELGILADVIDVYVMPGLTEEAFLALQRDDLANWTKAGTVREFVDTIETSTYGTLLANQDANLGLALKMREEAGNEYQNEALGAFDIKIVATQLASEEDSFGFDYDALADYDGEISNTASLEAALEKGGNYKFVGDVTVPAGTLPVVPEGVTAAIDLAGNDLSAENVQTEYALNNLGKLTIWDSTAIASTYSLRSTPTAAINARGIYNGYDKDGNYVSDAEITVLNGTINAKGTNGGAAIYNYGKVTIESGTFTSAGGYALNNQTGAEMIIKNASVTGGVYNCGDLTIENSTVYQHISGRHAVYNWSANLVINSGSFDSNSGNELILADGKGASVTINGGTFDKTAKSWLFGAATGKNITFDIYGGTFNGYVNMPEGTVDTVRPYGDPIVIYGGSFNFDPTTWVANKYIATKTDGRWVVDKKPVPTVSATTSADFADSLANSTGELLIDATGAEMKLEDFGTASGSYVQAVVRDGLTIKGATIDTSGNNRAFLTDGATSATGEIVFENCVFTTSDFSHKVYFQSGANAGNTKLIFNNCTFYGQVVVADNSGGGVEFNNCKFELNSANTAYIQCMGGNHAFNNCTFNIAGSGTFFNTTMTKYAHLNLYSERYNTNVTLSGCNSIPVHKFNASGGTGTVTVK